MQVVAKRRDGKNLAGYREWDWCSINTYMRTRPIQYYDELEWPENGTPVHTLQNVLRHAVVLSSSLSFQAMLAGVNRVVKKRSYADIDIEGPLLYPLPTSKALNVIGTDGLTFMIFVPGALQHVWTSQNPAHGDCTWPFLDRIVSKALFRLFK